MNYNKKLVLADGTEFLGYGYGADTEVLGEVVFNTSMVGYQEVATDPSYNGQIVVMTYPLIGNYGINKEDDESIGVLLNGFVVRDYNDHPSNFRSNKTFSKKLKDHNVPLLSGIDTRKLTRILRDKGTMNGIITSIHTTKEQALEKLSQYQNPTDQVKKVSSPRCWESKTDHPKYRIVCIDFGTKLNIIHKLNQSGCDVLVVPYNSTVEDVLKYEPDGLFLSNGPGNPEDNPIAIEVVRQLKGKIPIFGICLGHQIIALASGAKTYKMKFGHRGSNHPVKNLKNDKIEITSQNHSYAVDKESLNSTDLTITHINLLDQTVEGIENQEKYIFSVQYHPESSAGPEDSEYLFSEFMKMIERFKGDQNA